MPPSSSTPAPAAAHRKPVRLARHFSWATLVGVLLVTAALIFSWRALTVRHLIEHESHANADLTQAFVNSVWRPFQALAAPTAGRSRADLAAHPLVKPLRQQVLAKMQGLRVAKIKVYNPQGITVFSTDEKQIGENKADNAGLQQALRGQVVSLITYRDRFDAFEGVINHRNLISTYVPVRSSTGGPVDSVFEVYSDVTDMLERQQRALWEVAAVVLGLLAALYAFLLALVRRADRALARHEHERATREAQVQHQAYHDALTGLPNRAYFGERLAEVAARAQRQGPKAHRSALMFIDLDRFKFVNDSLGHEAGDLLLQEVARRLRAALRASDLLFRMGGDEFTVILPEIATPQEAAQVAQRLQAALAAPVKLREHDLPLAASIGIAVCPDDGVDADALLRNADAAMYSAKAGGRGMHAFYKEEMNLRARQRLELEAALKQGLRNDEFRLFYQPRLQAGSQQVVAVEALLRWERPGHGLVAPADFIGVLEDMGLMNAVGEWVLRGSCQQLLAWQAMGLAGLHVSVNVSVSQFENAGFLDMVRRVLNEAGVNATHIELDLTESMLIHHPAQAARTLAALKALGVRIAIDDFGTGYSSLNYLRHLSVDVLKIDRSFVTDISASARDRAVATAIVQLAQALDITVVAEGVETEDQAGFLRRLGCHEMQGYLFCRPQPPQALAGLLGGAGTAQNHKEPARQVAMT
ncbi:diguanylate cyclase (GGDEF) domain-containing protein [Burkholderiales bacterium JOSHI_001]|nr:diguanylate cyclase (GGDEF) domain-containing protein [Burkholderiales bacterium JOSHI_001]